MRQQAFVVTKVLMVLDALCVILAGLAAYYLRLHFPDGNWSMNEMVLVLSVVVIVVVNNYLSDKIGLYQHKRINSPRVLIQKILKAIIASFIVLGSIIFIIKEKRYSRAFMTYFAALSFLFLLIERLIFNVKIDIIRNNGFSSRNILIIGDEDRAQILVDFFENLLSWGHQVICFPFANKKRCSLPAEMLPNLSQILKQREVDEVIFAINGDASIDLMKYVDVCRKVGITVRILPALWHPTTNSLRAEQYEEIPFLSVRFNNFNASGLFYKRLLDVLGGLVGTVLFLVMYPFVGAAIKLDSPGPVFFKQDRIGKNGRVFKLLKFRSMHVDAEERRKELMAENEMKGPMFKLQYDPRVTRVGKFLRRTSLDEFPQFINVLKGEMSLVGTRPPTPEEVQVYDLQHLKRISVKPGITGLWQVSGRNSIRDFEEVVRLDCKYLENWEFFDDIRILLKTFVIVLARKGAH